MSKNDITGDAIRTKVGNNEAFAKGHDMIWGKKPRAESKVPVGYTAEELEKDNPYNQWMYEDAKPSSPD